MSVKESSSRRQLLKRSGAAAIGAVAAGAFGIRPAHAARKKKAPRWAMVIDLRRCTGCRTCTIACKAEFDTPLDSWNAVIKDVETGEYPNIRLDFLARLCNHCAGNEKDGIPPCVKECPEYPKNRRVFVTADGKKIRYRDGATYKRPDGMILFDNSMCIGAGKCIEACPYGARSFNKRLPAGKDPTKFGISKCSFCQHRVDKGVEPACVTACPNKARIFGDLNDQNSGVSRLAKEFGLLKNRGQTTLLPEEATFPHVFYIDPESVLSRYKITKENKMAEFRDKIA
jgi:tetrathionate reductase subunit B